MVVRVRRETPPERILVPVAGGPNSRLAIEVALSHAHGIQELCEGKVVVVHVLTVLRPDEVTGEEREQQLREALDIQGWPVPFISVISEDVMEAILETARGYDQVVLGASEEGLLEQQLFGSLPACIGEDASCTVVMVKRHDVVKFGLRRWLGWHKRTPVRAPERG